MEVILLALLIAALVLAGIALIDSPRSVSVWALFIVTFVLALGLGRL